MKFLFDLKKSHEIYMNVNKLRSLIWMWGVMHALCKGLCFALFSNHNMANCRLCCTEGDTMNFTVFKQRIVLWTYQIHLNTSLTVWGKKQKCVWFPGSFKCDLSVLSVILVLRFKLSPTNNPVYLINNVLFFGNLKVIIIDFLLKYAALNF